MGVPIACSEYGVMPEIGCDAAFCAGHGDAVEAGQVVALLSGGQGLRGQLGNQALVNERLFPSPAAIAHAAQDLVGCAGRERQP